jgi:hypothetical protein
MFDVEPFGVSRLSLPLAQRFGMTVDSVEVVFCGRCSRGAEQAATAGEQRVRQDAGRS